jgi:8-oxo-dGTP pyrophosphatase MutT (NUDIX family)
MKYVTNAFIFYNNKLLFVFHKRQNIWGHVGGHLESDEDFEEALLREIKEETGLDVEILNLDDKKLFNYFNRQEHDVKIKPLARPIFIHVTDVKGDKRTFLDYVCLAKSDKVSLQLEEASDYKWLTKEELKTIKTHNTWRELALKAFEIYNDNIY